MRGGAFCVCFAPHKPLWILILAYSSFENLFRLGYVLFYQFYVEFLIKKCLAWFLSNMLTSKNLAENDVNMTSKHANDIKTSQSTS